MSFWPAVIRPYDAAYRAAVRTAHHAAVLEPHCAADVSAFHHTNGTTYFAAQCPAILPADEYAVDAAIGTTQQETDHAAIQHPHSAAVRPTYRHADSTAIFGADDTAKRATNDAAFFTAINAAISTTISPAYGAAIFSSNVTAECLANTEANIATFW
jgi:hypothetical protein